MKKQNRRRAIRQLSRETMKRGRANEYDCDSDSDSDDDLSSAEEFEVQPRVWKVRGQHPRINTVTPMSFTSVRC